MLATPLNLTRDRSTIRTRGTNHSSLALAGTHGRTDSFSRFSILFVFEVHTRRILTFRSQVHRHRRNLKSLGCFRALTRSPSRTFPPRHMHVAPSSHLFQSSTSDRNSMVALFGRRFCSVPATRLEGFQTKFTDEPR
jgi:hypothetical protein